MEHARRAARSFSGYGRYATIAAGEALAFAAVALPAGGWQLAALATSCALMGFGAGQIAEADCREGGRDARL